MKTERLGPDRLKKSGSRIGGESDPREADMPLEAYHPSLVGRNSVRVTVRFSYVSTKVLPILVSAHYQGLYRTSL